MVKYKEKRSGLYRTCIVVIIDVGFALSTQIYISGQYNRSVR